MANPIQANSAAYEAAQAALAAAAVIVAAERSVCYAALVEIHALNEADNVTDLATAVDDLATVLDTTVR